MTVNLIDTAVIGYHNYDEYASSFMSTAKFRGKTLAEWEVEIELPNLNDIANIEDLKKANVKYVEMMRVILSNLAYAKTTLKACQMHYEARLSAAKNDMLEQYKKENPGKRIPGSDTILGLSIKTCQPEFIAVNIAEAFLDFWNVHHDKIRYFDSRLSSLGYILSTEEKYQFRMN